MGGGKTVGVLHNEAFEFLKKNYKQMWLISLVLYGVEMVLGIVVSVFIAPLQIFSSLTPALFSGSGDAWSVVLPMVGLLSVFGAVTFLLTVAVSIVQYASYIGGYDATLRMIDGGTVSFDAVWTNFKRNWKRFAGVTAWAMLWEFLWSLLFIVPGIVKSYSYKLAPFLVLRYPEMTVREALRKSIEITHGYKGRLFGLDIILFLYGIASILGICLVVVGVLAIEILWLTPMMLLLYSLAYTDIARAAAARGLLPPEPAGPAGETEKAVE